MPRLPVLPRRLTLAARHALPGRLTLRVLPALLAMTPLLAGCGGATDRSLTSAELQLQRAQLVQVSDGLRAAQLGVQREVRASRAVWGALAKGLPQSPSASLRREIAVASQSAGSLPTPAFLSNAQRLTGPASSVGGLYEAFARLSERGWRLTQATSDAIASTTPSAARFARGNSSLYIDAIYDAHFDLSLLGRRLGDGYRRLGGEGAFGSKLTQTEIDELRRVYSIREVRLSPHPAGQ